MHAMLMQNILESTRRSCRSPLVPLDKSEVGGESFSAVRLMLLHAIVWQNQIKSILMHMCENPLVHSFTKENNAFMNQSIRLLLSTWVNRFQIFFQI